MKFALLRAVGLLFAFAIGGCLPRLHTLGGLIRVGLMLMLFVVYLQMKPSMKMFHRSQLASILFCILFACSTWFGLTRAGYPELAQVAFFTAITPTATAAPVIVGMIGGNITYTVMAFLLSNLTISFALPLLIPMVIGNATPGLVQEVLKRILTVIFVPWILAILLRKITPERAERLGRRLAPWTFYVWIALVVLIAAQARHFLDGLPAMPWPTLGAIALLSLFICITNFIVGYRLGGSNYALECSQALGQKNNSYTVYLALTYATPLIALGPTIYVLWHNLWNAVQLYRFDARRP